MSGLPLVAENIYLSFNSDLFYQLYESGHLQRNSEGN